MTTKPYHEKPEFDYVELGLLKHAVNSILNDIATESVYQDDSVVRTRLQARRRRYLEINYKIIELLSKDPDRI